MLTDRHFVVAGLFAAFIGLGGGWWAAQPHSDLSQFERLGAEIGCQCGTCPLRPIATCGCAFADGMLTELAGLTSESMSDVEVMNTFATRYNDTVRIKPASSGFSLLAWVAPVFLLTVGAVGVGAVLSRWTHVTGTAARPATDIPETPATESQIAAGHSEAAAIVERELAALDD